MSLYSHFYQENTLSDSQSIELPSTSHQDSSATQSGSNFEALVDHDSRHEHPIATLSESMTEAPDIDNISSEEPSVLDSGANANIEPSAIHQPQSAQLISHLKFTKRTTGYLYFLFKKTTTCWYSQSLSHFMSL